MSDAVKRLWEVKHPYYMTEGNYYARDLHTQYECIKDFLDEYGDSEMDYNFVVRWDWHEGEDWNAREFNGDDHDHNGRFMVQFVGQRKSLLWTAEAAVCRADEPVVRQWLEPRMNYIKKMWEPLI